jgi:Domain of unknown function (DUF4357)
LKLYLVDGTPSGVITAELGISSVKAAVASRTALLDLIRRDEAGRTGVYLLLGPDPDLPGRSLVYVWEGDQVRSRLREHDNDEKKDFFTRAVLFVTKDDNLTKAHGRYLESRLIVAIRDAGRSKLVNGTEPESKGLPEPEIADMERVLDEIEVLLPILGFDVLTPPIQDTKVRESLAPGATVSRAEAPAIFLMDVQKAKGRAVERSGEFVVLAGSTALRRETPGIPQSTFERRKALVEAGVLVPDNDPDLYIFSQDASFGSASGASTVIAGRSDNGRTSWHLEGRGISYGNWRAEQISGDSGQSGSYGTS